MINDDFSNKMAEILQLANQLDEDGEAALSGERGSKAANKRVRQGISALRKLLPELRQLSLELERS